MPPSPIFWRLTAVLEVNLLILDISLASGEKSGDLKPPEYSRQTVAGYGFTPKLTLRFTTWNV